MSLTACSPKLGIVAIPSDTFEMGSNSGAENEKPVHKVKINSFFIGKTEVTVGEWRQFIAETNYISDAEKGEGSHKFNGEKYVLTKGVNWKSPGYNLNDNYLVTCISWNDCQAYIIWISQKSGCKFWLPTEAEWEYACKLDTSTDQLLNIDLIAWYIDNAAQSPHPIGKKHPNRYKLYYMLGNVWEFCGDWEGDYSDLLLINPTGSISGKKRIARGCGYLSGEKYISKTIRARAPQDLRAVDLGFRLALDSIK